MNTGYSLSTETLALIDTKANQTSSNLKNRLLSILRKNKINKQQNWKNFGCSFLKASLILKPDLRPFLYARI